MLTVLLIKLVQFWRIKFYSLFLRHSLVSITLPVHTAGTDSAIFFNNVIYKNAHVQINVRPLCDALGSPSSVWTQTPVGGR